MEGQSSCLTPAPTQATDSSPGWSEAKASEKTRKNRLSSQRQRQISLLSAAHWRGLSDGGGCPPRAVLTLRLGFILSGCPRRLKPLSETCGETKSGTEQQLART